MESNADERQAKGLPRTTAGQLRLEIITLWLRQLVPLCPLLHGTQHLGYGSVEGTQLDSLQKGANGLGEKEGVQVTGGFNEVKKKH